MQNINKKETIKCMEKLILEVYKIIQFCLSNLLNKSWQDCCPNCGTTSLLSPTINEYYHKINKLVPT